MPSQLVNLMRRLTWGDFGTPRAIAPPTPGQITRLAQTAVGFANSGMALDRVDSTTVRLRDSVPVTVNFDPSQSWGGRLGVPAVPAVPGRAAEPRAEPLRDRGYLGV